MSFFGRRSLTVLMYISLKLRTLAHALSSTSRSCVLCCFRPLRLMLRSEFTSLLQMYDKSSELKNITFVHFKGGKHAIRINWLVSVFLTDLKIFSLPWASQACGENKNNGSNFHILVKTLFLWLPVENSRLSQEHHRSGRMRQCSYTHEPYKLIKIFTNKLLLIKPLIPRHQTPLLQVLL